MLAPSPLFAEKRPDGPAARSSRNLSILLIVSLFLLIALLSESLLLRSREQAKRAGFGCDFNLAAPHTSNRTVGSVFCVDHRKPSSSHSSPSSPSQSSLRFLAVGDWGRDGYCCQLDIALEMARVAEAAGGIHFVANVGDSFYEYGLLAPDEEQVDTSFRDVYLQYPALRVPWYSVLGNHEYRGSAGAVVALGSRPGELFAMPDRYYDKQFSQSDGTSTHVWFLDTSPMIRAYFQSGYDDGKDSMLRQPDGITTQNVDKQLDWFERTLRGSKADVKIVVSHHPPFTSGSHYREDELFLRKKLSPLMEKHGVTLMLNGHDHTMQHYVKEKVHYFVTAAGSKVEAEFSNGDDHLRYYGRINGFLSVDVTASQTTVAIIDIKGDVVRTTLIKH